MALLISLVVAHRADQAVDEISLGLGDTVFLVENLVRPGSVPVLLRNPGVGCTGCVLTNLAEPDKEAEEPSLYVAFHVIRFDLRRCRQEQVGLSASGRIRSTSNRAFLGQGSARSAIRNLLPVSSPSMYQ